MLAHLRAIAAKDLRVERRSREVVATMAFFAALLVIVMAIGFDHERRFARTATPGLLWAAIAFAGTIGLGRAFDREREGDTMRALLLSPASRLGIFLGKAATIAILVFGVAAVCAPLTGLLLSVDLFVHPGYLAATLALGAIGVAVVGTVFAASLLKVRARDVLLPIVLYPLLIPLFVAGNRATGALLADPAQLDVARYWLGFLAVYDAVFLVVSLWLFESVVIE
ncbi:MAG: heme exporter protein CcmB [Kofleriaceae bacterium]